MWRTQQKIFSFKTVSIYAFIYHALFISGDIDGGNRYMKVVRAMNIIGPLTAVIIIIIAIVVPLTRGSSSSSRYHNKYN